MKEEIEDYPYEDDLETIDLFNKDDMKGNEWKRFQMGWHAGINFLFGNSFMIGASYGTDFSELAAKAKVQTLSVTLGCCF